MNISNMFSKFKNWLDWACTTESNQTKKQDCQRDVHENNRQIIKDAQISFYYNFENFVEDLKTKDMEFLILNYFGAYSHFYNMNDNYHKFDLELFSFKYGVFLFEIKLKQTDFLIVSTSNLNVWYQSGPWDDDLRKNIIKHLHELKNKQIEKEKKYFLSTNYDENVKMYNTNKEGNQ